MSDDRKKYKVAFDFTRSRKEELLPDVYTGKAGKRLIEAELGLEPVTENNETDLRYETDDAEKFAELVKLAFTISAGGWVVINPMPEGSTVFHLPSRGGKYGNE